MGPFSYLLSLQNIYRLNQMLRLDTTNENMAKTNVSPNEIIEVLESASLRESIRYFSKAWGECNLTEHTLVSIVHREVIEEIYLKNSEKKISRPFILEFRGSIGENGCDEGRCTSEDGRVDADLALITNKGKVLLWIEVKYLRRDHPLTESVVWRYRCDIKHASNFDQGVCLIFYEIIDSFGDEWDKLRELAESLGVKLIQISVRS